MRQANANEFKINLETGLPLQKEAPNKERRCFVGYRKAGRNTGCSVMAGGDEEEEMEGEIAKALQWHKGRSCAANKYITASQYSGRGRKRSAGG